MDEHELRERLAALGLVGLLEHFDELGPAEWVPQLVRIEEEERDRRSLERRRKTAKLGRYKPLADYDWSWPSRIDRKQVDRLLTLGFIDEGVNVILMGINGVGKTMLAKNLADACLFAGHTVRFLTASAMLNALAAEDSASALERRLRRLVRPKVLVVDEVGYLSYGNRHADLLFEVVTRRYEAHKPVIVTTNKAFGEWGEVFPNATCVVTLVDRLIHRSERVAIRGDSYRLKESGRPTSRTTPSTPDHVPRRRRRPWMARGPDGSSDPVRAHLRARETVRRGGWGPTNRPTTSRETCSGAIHGSRGERSGPTVLHRW